LLTWAESDVILHMDGREYDFWEALNNEYLANNSIP
jgi:hypothetical protein